MLHSGRLSLRHPKTGKMLDFRAPLPADFRAQIKALKKG
jgi:23S rRNA pseudouridine1911/1915/1917 synthase